MTSTKCYKVAGVNFDHMHMGDLLRLSWDHPNSQIVGVADADPTRMQGCIENFSIAPEQVYTDYHQMMEREKPDIVLVCSKTGEHADYVEALSPYGVHVVVEKPFAASLKDADRMISAMKPTGKQLVINWPLAWYPPHVTTHRLITEGAIGDLIEVHYYDGNRGPLRHIADKVEISAEEAARKKSEAWWYQKAAGGGSMMDYMGYGVSLATWFMNNRAPIEVTCTVDRQEGLEVDEHSITVCRYACGLSKFETRWGTFTDPWTTQPQPKCGFVVVGTAGTIASYDYQPVISIQTTDHPEAQEVPVDTLLAPNKNVIQRLIHCIEAGEAIDGPISPAVSRVGQQIIDSALLSAAERRTVPLVGGSLERN